jgi:signal transduction histidine kinase
MKLALKAFNTKVARRIFILFMVCAVLPVSVLAVISFSHVENQLNEQSRKRLRNENKALAMSIYERLLLLRAELHIVASNLDVRYESSSAFSGSYSDLKDWFTAFTVVTGSGKSIQIFGEIKDPPALSEEEIEHLDSGKALLHHRPHSDSMAIFFLAMRLKPRQSEKRILFARINSSFLWEAAEGRPPRSEVFVFDRSANLLFGSHQIRPEISGEILEAIKLKHAGSFEWCGPHEEYYASFWAVFLTPNFFSSEWVVVLSETREGVLAPMRDFRISFLVVIILSLGLVFFLSIGLIRKSLVPIEILKDATDRIARGGFGHKVEIGSGDEFESLGASFNEMSRKLEEGQALLVRAAKMGAMGQMAAGIVHEIKQPLTAIFSLLQLAVMKDPEGKSRKDLETAMEAVKRLDGILSRVKSFSHMADEKMEGLHLNEVLENVQRLFQHQFMMKEIHCATRMEEGLPDIFGNRDGLQQVFSNLIINAVDALESGQPEEPTISIRSYSSEDRVLVEFSDNGCGITEETMKHMFDPFFTTKSPDKGTGLGMAIVESILHKHEAEIEFESEVGVGTKFTASFPAFSEKPGGEGATGGGQRVVASERTDPNP